MNNLTEGSGFEEFLVTRFTDDEDDCLDHDDEENAVLQFPQLRKKIQANEGLDEDELDDNQNHDNVTPSKKHKFR